jgi:tetratricopeptide (TPR) repeat protein
MRKMLLSMACVAVAAFSAPLLADDREDCSSNDAERIIRGCTEVINSRQDLRQTLAIAHHRRGTAYASKKDYDRAIADYTIAIEIDPTHVAAYNDRGLAYTSKGDYERAIADVTRAVELTAPRPNAIGATPPPAGKTAKTEPKSTKTSATVDKSSAPAAAKSTTLATPPPSAKKAKGAPPDSAKTSTIAKGSAPPPAPAKAAPKATPGESGSDSPNWANQILNNKDMN